MSAARWWRRRARRSPNTPNAFVYQNNGMDLTCTSAEGPYDFAFSTIVFQHIPSREVIYNYVREVNRLLRPGALFKFQVQGDASMQTSPDDTWLGVPFSERGCVEMAEKCGFEPRYRHGAGEQYFWLWFFKQVEASVVFASTASKPSSSAFAPTPASVLQATYPCVRDG